MNATPSSDKPSGVKKRKRERRPLRCLPDGTYTQSVRAYVKAWDELATTAAEALGCDVIGFDPSIHLMPKGANIGFQIPPSVAYRIKALLK